ncbi:MAG: hypothetical protein NTY42_15070 [Planctomycetota bacterium]|nr:hypothetical protein [Planctomycetota bacterium]
MFGKLLLIAVSFITQGPQILPGSSLPGSSSINTPSPAERCKTGWGPDRETRKYVFTIQIDPSALATFAEGAFGKDMAAPVPEHIRPFVEEVIVRIGTADLARIDPTPEMQESMRRLHQPSLTTLDGRRGPVDIDRSLAVNNPQQILPPVNQQPDNNYVTNNFAGSSRNNSTDILPNDANRSPAILPNAPGSNNLPTNPYRPTTLADAPSLSGNTIPSNGGMNTDPRTSTQMRDEFRPANSLTNSMLSKMTGNTQPSVGSYTAPYTQGYSRTATNTTASPLTPPPVNPHYNTNPQASWSNTNPQASWSNGGIGPNVPTGFDPNYYVANNGGRTLPPQTNPVVMTGGPSTNGQMGGLGAGQVGGLGAGQVAGQGTGSGITEQGQQSSGSTSAVQWLPFVTILLLVVNIYQFFWMTHVRTRYKELVISKRNAQLNLAS